MLSRPRSGWQHRLNVLALLLRPSQSFARPNLFYNGLLPIQRLTLHLAASVQLRASPVSLAPEFPLLLFRLPAGCLVAGIVAVMHFDEHTRWLTTPFLRGFPPFETKTISRFTVNESETRKRINRPLFHLPLGYEDSP